MVFTIIAAVFIMGFFGVGPVLVGESCSSCSSETNTSVSKCDVDKVQDSMRLKKLPKELKVEEEGKLYSVPRDVDMVTPAPPPAARSKKWWKRFIGIDTDSDDDAKASSSDPATRSERNEDNSSSPSDNEDGDGANAMVVDKDVCSAGEHSCQICFGQDHSTVMLPCGHGGLCWDCGLQIYALTKECPMCRNKIELLVPLDTDKRRYEGKDEFVSSAVNCSKDGKPLVAALRSGPAALQPRENSTPALVE